eukprot:759549-Hanusia_phi.AAC.6
MPGTGTTASITFKSWRAMIEQPKPTASPSSAPKRRVAKKVTQKAMSSSHASSSYRWNGS